MGYYMNYIQCGVIKEPEDFVSKRYKAHMFTDMYMKHKDRIYLFLKHGERRKIDLQKHLGLTESQLKSILYSISKDWPIYESDDGRMIGWLK